MDWICPWCTHWWNKLQHCRDEWRKMKCSEVYLLSEECPMLLWDFYIYPAGLKQTNTPVMKIQLKSFTNVKLNWQLNQFNQFFGAGASSTKTSKGQCSEAGFWTGEGSDVMGRLFHWGLALAEAERGWQQQQRDLHSVEEKQGLFMCRWRPETHGPHIQEKQHSAEADGVDLAFLIKLWKTTVSFDVFLCFQLDQWPRFISARFQYTIYPITFSVGNAEEWKKLFKPCAAQRLFLPVRLQHLHSACDTIIHPKEQNASQTFT